MRKMLYALAVAALFVGGCSQEAFDPTRVEGNPEALRSEPLGRASRGKAVVANRGAGSISVIDYRTHEIETFPLPAAEGEPTPEPMYVVYTPRMQRVFVGDRANDRVAVFDARDYDVVGTAPAGRGVFHMWADPQGDQLWVNNDIDNTTNVIDPMTLQVVATVPTPIDLVAMGGKPHDVIVGPQGNYAYVTVVGVAGDSDYVVQFDTVSFLEMNRAPVGKDPHLSLARQHGHLFIPCQNSDAVYVLDRVTLQQEAVLDVPGAHGAAMTRNGRFFYTTNLTGGGTDAVFTIDTRTLSVVGDAADAPYPVPHNVALTPNGRKLFVTHSGGASDKVTIFTTADGDVQPVYADEVTVGLNPFGIAFVQ